MSTAAARARGRARQFRANMTANRRFLDPLERLLIDDKKDSTPGAVDAHQTTGNAHLGSHGRRSAAVLTNEPATTALSWVKKTQEDERLMPGDFPDVQDNVPAPPLTLAERLMRRFPGDNPNKVYVERKKRPGDNPSKRYPLVEAVPKNSALGIAANSGRRREASFTARIAQLERDEAEARRRLLGDDGDNNTPSPDTFFDKIGLDVNKTTGMILALIFYIVRMILVDVFLSSSVRFVCWFFTQAKECYNSVDARNIDKFWTAVWLAFLAILASFFVFSVLIPIVKSVFFFLGPFGNLFVVVAVLAWLVVWSKRQQAARRRYENCKCNQRICRCGLCRYGMDEAIAYGVWIDPKIIEKKEREAAEKRRQEAARKEQEEREEAEWREKRKRFLEIYPPPVKVDRPYGVVRNLYAHGYTRYYY